MTDDTPSNAQLHTHNCYNMGCGASKQSDRKVAADPAAGGNNAAAVDVPTDMDQFTKKFHSKVRWDKELSEITPFIDANPDGLNCKDAGNGNTPIHIAAQNGHIHLGPYIMRE